MSKEKETLTDAWIRRIKDHPIGAPVVFFFVVIGAAALLVSQLGDAWQVLSPHQPAPTAGPETSAVPSPLPSESLPRAPEKQEPNERPKTSVGTPKAPVEKPKDRLFVDCQYGVMPSIVPPEGRIHVLITSELPVVMGGGGLADFFGKPGSDWSFTNEGLPAWAYRCELTNYSTEVVFNIVIPVHLTFWTALPVPNQDKARRPGTITLERDWPFTVSKLDPSPGASYVFYVRNCCVQRFVEVKLPDHVVADKNRKIQLLQAAGILSQPLNPVPFS
jgi:hypothetical protein